MSEAQPVDSRSPGLGFSPQWVTVALFGDIDIATGAATLDAIMTAASPAWPTAAG